MYDPNENRPGYKKTKVGWIPERWSFSTIGKNAKTFSGGTPDRGDPCNYGGNIPWIKSGELNHKYITDTEERVTASALKNSSAKMVDEHTLLYALYGATAGIPAITVINASINQAVLAIMINGHIDKYFLYFFLSHGRSKLVSRYTQGGQPNLSAKIVKAFQIPLPPLPEQQKIADILTTWDNAIDKTRYLIAAKRKQKKGLMQQLLTGKRRLPGFGPTVNMVAHRFFTIPSDWNYPQIKEIASEKSERNSDGSDVTVLSCSKHLGFVESSSYFKKQIHSEDTSNYKVIHRGQFGYPSNHVEEGSIGFLTSHDVGIVSPIYTVFQARKSVSSDYLYAHFKSETFRHIFQVSTNASVDRRGNLKWNAFSLIRVPLPSLAEQHAIAKVLDTADCEIQTLVSKLAALERQKKGLMQRLLTGQIRVKVDAA